MQTVFQATGFFRGLVCLATLRELGYYSHWAALWSSEVSTKQRTRDELFSEL